MKPLVVIRIPKVSERARQRAVIFFFCLIIAFSIYTHLFSAKFYPQTVSREDAWYVGAVNASAHGTLSSYAFNYTYNGITQHIIYNPAQYGYGMIYIPILFNFVFHNPLNSVIFTGMLFGVLFLISIYFFTYEFTRSRGAALVSMLVLAATPSFLYSNTFGRYEGESILPFFVSLLLIFLLKAQDDRRWLIPFAVLLSLVWGLWNGAYYAYGIVSIIAFYLAARWLLPSIPRAAYILATAAMAAFLYLSVSFPAQLVLKFLPINPFDQTFQYLTFNSFLFNSAMIGLLAIPALPLAVAEVGKGDPKHDMAIYALGAMVLLGFYLSANFTRWWEFTAMPVAVLTSYMLLRLYEGRHYYTLMLAGLVLFYAAVMAVVWMHGISPVGFW